EGRKSVRQDGRSGVRDRVSESGRLAQMLRPLRPRLPRSVALPVAQAASHVKTKPPPGSLVSTDEAAWATAAPEGFHYLAMEFAGEGSARGTCAIFPGASTAGESAGCA